MFFMFAIMFFGLAIMSIVEYCMIWKKYTEDDLFVLMCIFQNLLHSHFFAIELNHIINKRVNALRDYEQDPVNEF
jgi:hypothetical protein